MGWLSFSLGKQLETASVGRLAAGFDWSGLSLASLSCACGWLP